MCRKEGPMGEGDPRAVSARLPGAVLQATGDPVGDRRLSLVEELEIPEE